MNALCRLDATSRIRDHCGSLPQPGAHQFVTYNCLVQTPGAAPEYSMPTTLTIRDESTGEGTLHEFALEVLSERISVRELIRSRVYQEVQDYNRRQPKVFRGLVQPADAERTLNGYKLAKPRQIDWQQQYARALAAFEAKRFLVLVDDRQVDALDDEITVAPGTSVSFLRLTPLVGG